MKACTYLGVCALLISMSPLSLPLEAANVVFVGDIDADGMGDGEALEWAAADVSMVSHLTNVLGHTVTSVDDSLVTATAVAGADFIVVSATAGSNAFANNDSGDGSSGGTNALGTDATIIIMESGSNIVRKFGMVRDVDGGSFGTALGTSLEIVALDGYLTNTFGLGTLTIYNNPEDGGEEIRGFGAVPPAGANVGFPQLDYTGNLILGSTIVQGFPAVVLGSHQNGDNTIVALPFGNGGFDHLTADGLQLFNNAFANVGLAGDYSGDGKVDAADYVMWRNSPGDFGGDPDGYNTWRANFGAPSGIGAASSVPEPTAAMLLIVGMACLGGRWLAREVATPSVFSK